MFSIVSSQEPWVSQQDRIFTTCSKYWEINPLSEGALMRLERVWHEFASMFLTKSWVFWASWMALPGVSSLPSPTSSSMDPVSFGNAGFKIPEDLQASQLEYCREAGLTPVLLSTLSPGRNTAHNWLFQHKLPIFWSYLVLGTWSPRWVHLISHSLNTFI